MSDEDILHAWRNRLRQYVVDDDGFTIVLGPAWDGSILELGFVRSEPESIVIVHCMPARPRFLR
jgi:hypothetical protein